MWPGDKQRPCWVIDGGADAWRVWNKLMLKRSFDWNEMLERFSSRLLIGWNWKRLERMQKNATGGGGGGGGRGGVAQQRPRMNGPMAAEFERAPNQLAHWSIRWWIRWKVTLVVAPLVEGAWTCWFVRVVSPLNGWHPVAYSLSTSWLSFLRFPFSFHFYFSVFISQIEIYIDIHFCLVVSSFVLSYQLIVAQCDGRDSEKFHHLSIEERRGVCVR